MMDGPEPAATRGGWGMKWGGGGMHMDGEKRREE